VMAAREVVGDPLMQPPNDSMSWTYKPMPKYDRPICLKVDEQGKVLNELDPNQRVHESVLARWKSIPSYRPPKLVEYFKRNPAAAP
jgi:hypothetical protein